MNEGYIKIHRKMIDDWEWYSNINDTRLWIHCLLKANWKDGWFEGVKIDRGSFATSYSNLAKETDLSVKQVRTSLEHLKRANNVAIKSYPKFSMITILKYDLYQADGTVEGKQRASEGQAKGKQRATIEERKKIVSMYVGCNNNAHARERIISPVEIELIDNWLSEYNFELIEHAVKISLLKNKESLLYANGILTNWKLEGKTKLEDVLEKTTSPTLESKENEIPIEFFSCNWLEEE